jgi:hypothetical protein
VGAYSPEDPKPLRSYAALTAAFNGGVVAFEAARRRRGWALPERIGPGDLALLAAGTYKLSRLISKDRVTSFVRAPFTRYTGEAGPAEVSEEPRGQGMRRAIGELLVCPYCVEQWVAAGFLGAYIRDPRGARTMASLFTVFAAADWLSQGWMALQEHT